MPASPVMDGTAAALHRELWTSFVSVLRSYLAAHTLNRSEQAILEVSADSLLVRVGARSLRIEYPATEIIGTHVACHPERSGPAVSAHGVEGPAVAFGTWQRETGPPVAFRFDEQGRIITGGQTEEMDIIAERLAREITQ